jgi:DtxR family manganese transport transcriptional regulator
MENPFVRAREDHRAEVREDYVELIYRLGKGRAGVRTGELVSALGVAQPTVTQTLDRLAREGLVSVERRRGVWLTEEGRRLAREAKDRHELTVRFLTAIGVPAPVAEMDAEGIEHHLSATTIAAMSRFLEERA